MKAHSKISALLRLSRGQSLMWQKPEGDLTVTRPNCKSWIHSGSDVGGTNLNVICIKGVVNYDLTLGGEYDGKTKKKANNRIEEFLV